MSGWRCGECGAEGQAKTAQESADEFTKHWIEKHQEVNF